MATAAADTVERVYRNEWGRIVATLIRLLGDFDLAEECAQEAFTAAVDQWEETGVQTEKQDISAGRFEPHKREQMYRHA